MKKETTMISVVCLCLAFFTLLQPVQAEDMSGKKQDSDADLAQKLSNPIPGEFCITYINVNYMR